MRTKRFLLMSFLAITVIFAFSFANPAQAQLSDTVYVDNVQVDPSPTDSVVFSVPVNLFTTEQINAASLGIYYDSGDITIDSISLTGGGAEMTINNSQVNAAGQYGFIGFLYYPTPPFRPFPPSDSLLATLWFTLAAGAADQTINLDSGFVPPAGNFLLTSAGGTSIFPAYKAGTITVGTGGAAPELNVDPAALTFDAIEGGSNPANKSFNITNAGSGDLNWTASEAESWLSLSATSGTAPSTVNVIVDISGLSAGTHVGTVTITAPGADNSPQDVTITLNLAEPPATIGLSQTTFDFEAVEGAKANLFDTLAISNTGGGTLNWTAANVESWLTIDPASGTAPSDMELAVATDGLAAGDYHDSIQVSAIGATNTPQMVYVNLTVTPAPAEITLSEGTLDFNAVQDGVNPSDQNFTLTNSGGVILHYAITKSSSWLSTAPTSGDLAPAGDQLVTVSVDISGLSFGTYKDTIVVADPAASNSPQLVEVTLNLAEPAPEIAVDPASFTFDAVFGTNPDDQNLDITNAGGGALNYSISHLTTWLTVAPTSGTAPGTSALSVNTAGLAVGTYYDTLTISAVGASNTPVAVPVTLNVLDLDPVIVLDQTQYYFALEEGNNSNSGTLVVSNGGGGTLNWSASKLQSWLTIDPTSGTAPSTITLTVNNNGLAVGTYYDTITVVGAGATNTPQKVEVVMDVVAEAQFMVTSEGSPVTELVFEGNAAKSLDDQVINIASSSGAIPFGITNNQAWLSADPAGATTPQDVTVSVNITGISAGTYYDTLFISEVPGKAATTVEIPVTLILSEVQAQFVVDPVEMTFNSTGGFDPSSQDLTINSDGDNLDFDLSQSSSWLSLNTNSGTTNAVIEVSASISGLAAGTYYDTIIVSDAGVKSADPVNVPVTLNVDVAYEPIIALNPTSFLFESTEGGADPETQTLDITNAGTGPLAWNAFYDAGWLMVSPGSGSAPSSVSISANISGLIAGTYVDTIDITCNEASNSPESAIVTLIVNPQSSQGGDTVWVTTDTTMVGQDAVVEIMFINDNLISGIQIPLYFNNSLMDCDSVSFAGSRVEGADMLLAPIDSSAGTINIGVVPTESALIPAGEGLLATLYFSATAAGFAEIDTGFIDPASEYVFVDENVQPFYPVFDDGGVQINEVVMPHIVVSATEFNFEGDQDGSDPATQNLVITNGGVGVLNWSVVNTTSWLSLNPASGGDGDATTLTVSLAGLLAGNYGDSIVVSDPAADNSPVIVFVNLTVNPPPADMDTVRVATVTIAPSPTDPVAFSVPVTLYNMETINAASLGLYYGPGDVTIDSISLIGGSAENTINNSVVNPADRLAAIGFLYFPGPPGASPVPPGDSLLANLWFTLAAGAVNQVIPIDSGFFPPAGPFVLTNAGGVSVEPAFVQGSIIVHTIVENPSLAVDPTSLFFEGVEGESNNVIQNVNITNTGGGELNWTADFNSVWLNVTPLSGTAPSQLDVSVDMDTLAKGVYVDTITIDAGAADNSPQKVVVTLTVNPAPPEPGLFGTVIEADGGEPVVNATVAVFATYPRTPIDQTTTDSLGDFEFPTLPVGSYMLRAYKDGYYPSMLEVEVGKLTVEVELVKSEQAPIPTYEWVNFYCDENYFSGELIQPGDVIEAYDPDGVCCGQYFVDTEGAYGFMAVYRDDEYSEDVDEGCDPGDAISFKINGYPAQTSEDAVWTENGDDFQVCLDAESTVTKCIHLNEGWNLISWNVDTESDDIEDLIADIKGDVDVILGFEAGAMTYDPDLPGFNTLETMDHFHGYWFRMDNPATLCVTGAPVAASTPIALEMGWNLASYLPDAEDDIEHALAGIMDKLLMVLGFDGGGVSYDPDLGEFSTLLTMAPDFGYWIKVTEDVMLSYPGEAIPGFAKAVPDMFTNHNDMSSVKATNTWINAYSRNLIVDGEPIQSGSLIEAIDINGNVCGSCDVTETGKFGFMAIYGAENGSGEGLTRGDQFTLRINGVETEEAFTFTGNGDRTMIGSVSLKAGSAVIPTQYNLSQNYPNPFNPETAISFDIPVEARVKLTVYNILGEKVTTLVDEQKTAGSYTVIWNGQADNGSTVSSGIYFYRLDAGEYVKSMKMTLMK